MTPNSPPAVSPDLELDAWLEPFESAVEGGASPDPADYLPEATHPKYLAALCELLRVDLEFAWARGDDRRVEDYADRFPALFTDKPSLTAVALEEYRQRRAAGEEPDPAEYRRRFGIELPVIPRKIVPDAPTWDGKQFPDSGQMVEPGYRIVSELGRGAFGRVYLAEQADLANRRVAIKISSRLIGEAQTLARLQHTHIVPVYAVHRVGTYQVLVMPYRGGETLADRMASVQTGGSGRATERSILTAISSHRHPPTTAPSPPPADAEPVGAMLADRVVEIGIALADALAHAHERGILHRDVKPANVLLTEDGEPMLLDFNLAVDDHGQAASAGGTPRYMAPEQIAALDNPTVSVDGRADLYSLGLVLCELLTGQLPFPDRRGPWAEVGPLQFADRRRPADFEVESPALGAILRKCLQPERAARYTSAAELRDDLRRHRDNQPLKFAAEPWSTERVRKWARRHPRLSSATTVAIAAGILLFAGIAGGYTIWQANGELRAREARAGVNRTIEDVAPLVAETAAPDGQLREARSRVFEAIEPYKVLAGDDWLAGRNVRRLPDVEQSSLRAEIGQLLYFGAEASGRLATRERDASRRIELFDQAITLNERAVAAFAGSDRHRQVLGQRVWLLESAGRQADREREDFDNAPTAGPTNEIFGALLAIHERRYRDAIEPLDAATRRDRANWQAWYGLGSACLGAHQYDRAAAAFLAAAAIKPDQPWAWLYRGLALIEARQFEAAIEALDRFVGQRPEEAIGYLNRALAKIRLERPESALDDLSSVERLGSSAARVSGLREIAWRLKGDQAKATESHRLLLASTPDDAEGFTIRGEAKLAADAAGALADFDAALAIRPDFAPAIRGRASCLSEKLNRPADAAADLDRLRIMEAATVEDLAGYAVLLARLGRSADARARARECVKRETPALPLYQTASALALTATTPAERAEAIDVLRRVIQLDAKWAGEMTIDSDLRSVRDDKDFQALLTAGRVIAGPAKR